MTTQAEKIKTQAADLAADLMRKFPAQPRVLVALAGPPASGKSTMAEALVAALQDNGETAALLPMDGFHLDNDTLDALGLRARKGAPETFDCEGFLALVRKARAGGDLSAPGFDRARDSSIADAITIPASTRFVVAEGNYLLFDEPGWRDLARLWDYSVFIAPPIDILRDRLIDRWLHFGLDQQTATARTGANDLPNASRVLDRQLPASMSLV